MEHNFKILEEAFHKHMFYFRGSVQYNPYYGTQAMRVMLTYADKSFFTLTKNVTLDGLRQCISALLSDDVLYKLCGEFGPQFDKLRADIDAAFGT